MEDMSGASPEKPKGATADAAAPPGASIREGKEELLKKGSPPNGSLIIELIMRSIWLKMLRVLRKEREAD